MEYKGYRVTPLGTYSLLKIQAKGSGTIPDALNGSFTSSKEATLAIDKYLSSLTKQGGRKHGKAS